jgi:deoxyribose-phosphate aldolase
MSITASELASRIDHTILKPEASAEDVQRLCAEAREYRFGAVCINPARVRLATDEVGGSGVPVCSVVGFPLGATRPDSKVFETRGALEDGATEIDMVMNIGALRDRDFEAVHRDIAAVREATGSNILKVIIEAAILSDEEIARAAAISIEAGADFVKTSTGFNAAGGARVEHVRLIRDTIGSKGRIKAAGGIRDLPGALALIEAGADRLGASASVAILAAMQQESISG